MLVLIYSAVGFPARIEGCCVTPLDHVRTSICACCELCVELILARHLPVRSTEKPVEHSSEHFRKNAGRLVLNLNICAGRTPRAFLTLLWCGRMIASGRGLSYCLLSHGQHS